MNLMAKDSAWRTPDRMTSTAASGRDAGIDTMRGIAILMVIGIHSLQQPLGSWTIPIDAALRPCVPIFLFASGYLTAHTGRVPLWKRLKATLIPYSIAFGAAYIYIAAHNPAMDHRLITTIARYVLAYMFVYYYVFVYVGCTLGLWLVFSVSRLGAPPSEIRLVVLLLLAIALGLIAGSYLDPLLSRLGFPDPVVEEVRMRDIPFWFSFMALGTLIGLARTGSNPGDTRVLLSGATLVAFVIYAAVRLFGIGDAADYDSLAFFGYAALLVVLLLVLDIRSPYLATLGAGSYFIYLWHIFIVMTLRDHAALHRFGPVANFSITYAVTVLGSIAALLAIETAAPSRLRRWLGVS
jgi:surface polysaccharide O-acyltransferase-like enzyme